MARYRNLDRAERKRSFTSYINSSGSVASGVSSSVNTRRAEDEAEADDDSLTSSFICRNIAILQVASVTSAVHPD